mgnify:CR=1 FL=1
MFENGQRERHGEDADTKAGADPRGVDGPQVRHQRAESHGRLRLVTDQGNRYSPGSCSCGLGGYPT